MGSCCLLDITLLSYICADKCEMDRGLVIIRHSHKSLVTFKCSSNDRKKHELDPSRRNNIYYKHTDMLRINKVELSAENFNSESYNDSIIFF